MVIQISVLAAARVSPDSGNLRRCSFLMSRNPRCMTLKVKEQAGTPLGDMKAVYLKSVDVGFLSWTWCVHHVKQPADPIKWLRVCDRNSQTGGQWQHQTWKWDPIVQELGQVIPTRQVISEPVKPTIVVDQPALKIRSTWIHHPSRGQCSSTGMFSILVPSATTPCGMCNAGASWQPSGVADLVSLTFSHQHRTLEPKSFTSWTFRQMIHVAKSNRILTCKGLRFDFQVNLSNFSPRTCPLTSVGNHWS